MPAFTHQLARWFHDHHGIVAGRDLRAMGVSTAQRRALLVAGVLEEVFEGVYRHVAVPLDFEARCTAVCAADLSMVLSCFTAGSLKGLRRCGHPWIHATTTRSTKPIRSGVRIHRTAELPAEDIVERADGIRLTSVARTWFDLAKHVSDLTLASILEQILDDRLATLDEVTATVLRLARHGRPGSRRALRVLASRPVDERAADSHDEVVLLAALHAAGLHEFVRQPEVVLRDSRVVHPDLGVPAVGFYVEVDHHTWHAGKESVDYDKDRDRQIRLAGAVVERVTDTHIRRDLPRVVAEVRELYMRRLADPGAAVLLSSTAAPKS